MKLVDSSVWIDYFNGRSNKQTDKLDDLLKNDLIITGDIILAEVLQGFKNENEFRMAKKHLERLICKSISSKEIALKSAENFRLLRKKGITIRKTVDMLIGTFCIEHNIPLLTGDRDFIPMTDLGLRLV